jgi:FkbM family methyltransferase
MQNNLSVPKEFNTRFFDRMKLNGLVFHNIIDVGAYKGNWTKKTKESYPDANYYLIDANDQFKEELNKLGTFYCEVLSEKGGEREFYNSLDKNNNTGSSLYAENSNVNFDKIIKHTKRLIDVVPSDVTFDFIKMDVQGAELEIIEGSLDLFLKTKFVQLECPVHPNNVGAPLFEHYINYMANSNFKVFDINSIFFNNKLMAVDFIFVNKVLPKLSTLENETLYYKN